ncbi:WD-40 repeat-containing protein [[Leptolyngbya] sp. PCC 7376]|uniref:WD40 domain-containing protein n=1 Tax=[Leptolyngbya] sp. PCC 7376 TaxID=111781 RepID=UPI00029F16CB|nr:NB-ARC domain-containing protein [[Leptolyngbya] sp. PCC 7376]AFY39929.1 WD-40 repeat-containing protein [[Leptolyngbya] sp. PCC 7376]
MKRSRGVALTLLGKYRLETAIQSAQDREQWGGYFTQQQLAKRAGIVYKTIKKIRERSGPADVSSLQKLFKAFELTLEPRDYCLYDAAKKKIQTALFKTGRRDWLEAKKVPNFQGRKTELEILRNWILDEQCKLVTLLGMGGIGKSVLAEKLGTEVASYFYAAIWLDLRETPPIDHTLSRLIEFLSDHTESNIATPFSSSLSKIIHYLQKERCLIILDNFEALFKSGEFSGGYKESYENYGKLIQRIGESDHQSCLIITSREKPQEICQLEQLKYQARTLEVKGFSISESNHFLMSISGRNDGFYLSRVYKACGGNPLMMIWGINIISETIERESPHFDVNQIIFFKSSQDLLDKQFNCLTEIEKEILYWLAINREPISFEELRKDFFPTPQDHKILEAWHSLIRRSFIDQTTRKFTLQAVVMEYITSRLIQKISQELASQEFRLFNKLSLTKANIKDYVRSNQVRLILEPIIEQIQDFHVCIRRTLSTIRQQRQLSEGYAPGNLLNLIICKPDNRYEYDFSGFTIRQACLKNSNQNRFIFRNSLFVRPALSDSFGLIFSVRISPDGNHLFAGGSDGTIHVWNIHTREYTASLQGHSSWLRAIAMSEHNRLIAGSHEHGEIRFWDLDTFQHLETLKLQGGSVLSTAFSPEQDILAVGCRDGQIRLCMIGERIECFQTIKAHSLRIFSVRFSPDGMLLASGSQDGCIKLWNTTSYKCVIELVADSYVFSVAFHPNGSLLASGHEDKCIRLWNLHTGQCLNCFQLEEFVFSVAFSPDGEILASGSEDGSVRLWSVQDRNCIKVFQDHTQRIWSVAFHPIDNMLISGSEDCSIRFWDIKEQKCLQVLQGYPYAHWSLAYSPNGQFLATGSEKGNFCLWDLNKGAYIQPLRQHSNVVASVAFSPDDHFLATGSGDGTICLWDLKTLGCIKVFAFEDGNHAPAWSLDFNRSGTRLISGGVDRNLRIWDLENYQLLQRLSGHNDWIWSVTYSPDNQIIASGDESGLIILWDGNSFQQKHQFQASSGAIRSIAFHPNGDRFASMGDDGQVCVWDVNTHQCLVTIESHEHMNFSVAFSPDGKWLACGSYENTIRLWNTKDYQCSQVLSGHNEPVWLVAFHPQGKTLASGSQNGHIYLWDFEDGKCTANLIAPRPYENTNITGVRGLTTAQRAAMRSLGAIESEEAS